MCGENEGEARTRGACLAAGRGGWRHWFSAKQPWIFGSFSYRRRIGAGITNWFGGKKGHVEIERLFPRFFGSKRFSYLCLILILDPKGFRIFWIQKVSVSSWIQKVFVSLPPHIARHPPTHENRHHPPSINININHGGDGGGSSSIKVQSTSPPPRRRAGIDIWIGGHCRASKNY